MPFQKAEKKEPVKKVEVEVPTTNAGKFAALMKLSADLDRKFDTSNTLIRLGKQVGKLIPSICTGCPSLDYYVFGCGGVPRGAVIEIFGPESSGKTTTALQIVAAEQQAGGIAAYVDAEHALDPTYAACLGVDVDNLMVNQPDDGNQALETVDALIDSKLVNIIIVDSVAALVPKAELAGDIGDQHPGLQARLMSQALRMITGKAKRNKVTVIFINQIREKIGVMFGNPETTPGGKALKFYATIRIDVRRREVIKDGAGESAPIVGHTLELKAQKNKAGSPFRSTKLDLYYPGSRFAPGIDKIGDLIEYAKKKDIFEMHGSRFYLDLGNVDEKKKPVGPEDLANGVANLKDEMKKNPKIEQILRKKLDELKKAELANDVKAAEAMV